MAVGTTYEEATRKLQNTVNQINDWTKLCWIRLNKSKSIHINFTNKRKQNILVTINTWVLDCTSKLFGYCSRCKALLEGPCKKKKRDKLSLCNQILLYIQIRTYGIHLWECACKTNIEIIQSFQTNTNKLC